MTTHTREHKASTILTRVTYSLERGGNNPLAHFSVTADQYEKKCWFAGGCPHDEVLAIWPDLAPLVALHLSDSDGVPMHAEANGWYWLAGALGGMSERYHGGNSSDGRTPEQCLAIFAEHCRIGISDAQSIAEVCKAADEPRKVWTAHCDLMRPRWKAEADEAICRFNLFQS